VIVIGHPRAAPILLDLLSSLPFRVVFRTPGVSPYGFESTDVRPGEESLYKPATPDFLVSSDESTPDFGLVTSYRDGSGGEWLSIFGNRVQSSGYLVSRLLDATFLDQLDSKVFRSKPAPYRWLQVALRIDYSKGLPTGLVYLTHRMKQ
jgi:hypothetical protein